MNKTLKTTLQALGLAGFYVLISVCAFAQGQHPAYLHALTDLRAARAHLQRPDRGALRQQEKDAIQEIDAAIGEIKKASIDDHKGLEDHEPVDAKLDWPGRLHRSIELLKKARTDISQEEDNRFARGLQDRAYEHIDKAIRHAEEAVAIKGY